MAHTPKPLRRWRRKVDRVISQFMREDLPAWALASFRLTPRNLRRWR